MVDTFKSLFKKVLCYSWPVQCFLPRIYPGVVDEVDISVKDSSVGLASFLGVFVEVQGVA